MLKKDNKHQQMVYYQVRKKKNSLNVQLTSISQAGIGTYNIPEIAKPWMAKLSRTLDMMIGIHLNAHIMGTFSSSSSLLCEVDCLIGLLGGYEFLMENYQSGDRIFIFGFSRGAYTARALAGM